MKMLKPIIAGASLFATITASAGMNSEIGRGVLTFDMDAGKKDRCIKLEDTDVYEKDFNQTTFEMNLVKSKEQMIKTMSESTSASGNYGSFSASGKAKFSKRVEWNYTSNYILVSAKRITKKNLIKLDNVMLSEHGRNLLLASRTLFAESCGDKFAMSVNYGGEVVGVIEIKNSSYQEKRKTERSLKASGSFKGGSASGKTSMVSTIQKFNSDERVTVHIHHSGGEGQQLPTTIPGLIELVTNIEKDSDEKPTPISYDLREYQTLSNYVFENNNVDVQIREADIEFTRGKLRATSELFAQITYILENPQDFRRFNSNVLKDKQKYLGEKILEFKEFMAKSRSFLYEVDIDELEVDLDIRLPNKKWRRKLNYICEVKEDSTCGVKRYRNQVSAACGYNGVQTGKGPVCGKIYKLKESNRCEPVLFKQSSGSVCGRKRWKQCHTSKCGYNTDGSRRRCRNKRCGAEWKTCRHESFGGEKFKACRHPDHGFESFRSCADKAFGYVFNSCEHFQHGPESFKSCEVAEIGSQVVACPNL